MDDTGIMRRAYITSGLVDEDLKDAETAGEKTWTTAEMAAEFDVIGFAAPFVVVRRKADGVEGSLEFRHSPRVYFGFRPHEE